MGLGNWFKSTSEAEVIPPQKYTPKPGGKGAVNPEKTGGKVTTVKELKSNGVVSDEKKTPFKYSKIEALKGDINTNELPAVLQHTGETGSELFSNSFAFCQAIYLKADKPENDGLYHSFSPYSKQDINNLKDRFSGQNSNVYVMKTLPQQYNEHQKNSYIFVQDKPDSKNISLYYIDKDKQPHKVTEVQEGKENIQFSDIVRELIRNTISDKEVDENIPEKDLLNNLKNGDSISAKMALRMFEKIDSRNETKKQNIKEPDIKEICIFQKKTREAHNFLPYAALFMAIKFNCRNVKMVQEEYSGIHVKDRHITLFEKEETVSDSTKSTNLKFEDAQAKETASYFNLKECFEQVFAMEREKGVTVNEKGDFYFPIYKITVPAKFVPDEYKIHPDVMKNLKNKDNSPPPKSEELLKTVDLSSLSKGQDLHQDKKNTLFKRN